MKFPAKLIVTVLTTVIASASLADNGPATGCKNLGSWLGYDTFGSAWWMSNADGQNPDHGTLNLEVPGAVAFIPGAFAVTELRGVWEKIESNTLAWTAVGFAYDAAGTTLALARVSGKHSSSKDCNTAYHTDTLLELFAPNANVDNDEPFAATPLADFEGYRVKLVTFDLP